MKSFILIALLSVVAAESVYNHEPTHYTDSHHAADYHHTNEYKPVVYEAHQPTDYSHKPVYSAPAYNHKEYNYAPAHYTYSYAVKDDYHYVDMDKYETRDGDNTKGSYSVVLPDGRRQIVTYYVDGYSGYVADVKYEGVAKPYEYVKPAYHAPMYHAPAYETHAVEYHN